MESQVHIPERLSLKISQEALVAICTHYRVHTLALFGSVLRNDFTSASDVDVLVTFLPEAPLTLFWLGGLKTALEDLFHRRVDLTHQPALKPFLQDTILTAKEVLYVQAIEPHG